jgi:hypothetical protein
LQSNVSCYLLKQTGYRRGVERSFSRATNSSQIAES